jgi:hypothetical protein
VAWKIVWCIILAEPPGESMSELDVVKEQIAYLKFWLGILVITDISLFGWLLSNVGSANLLLVSGGCFAVVAITVGIILLHRRIERQIESLREF